MQLKKLFWNVLQLVVVLVLFYYVISPLVKNAKAFKETFLTLDLWFLASGIILLSLVIFCYPFVWRYILKGFGVEIQPSMAVISWIYSNVGKYMPGKIWQFVGRVALTKDVIPEITLATVFLEVIISSSSAVMVFFARFFLKGGIPQLWAVYALILFTVLLLLQHPIVVKFFLKIFAKIRKQNYDFGKISIPLKRNLLVFLWYFTLWIATGVSFWVMIQRSNINVSLFDSITTYPISWILGYLALVAPAGFGVRESVLMTLLKTSYSVEVASAFSILTRIALIFSDFLLFFITMLVLRNPFVAHKDGDGK
ncbi:MAG: lysylphosphatidylglycerol synthase domain-containing protein [bacterium]|nr:lysylphosphatidylglycerol synthase domain-containing protein [bacterium]